MNVEIAKRIKKYRQDLGLTQKDVGDALGIDRSTYARQENSGMIRSDLVFKLAEILHVSPNQILFGESKERELPKPIFDIDMNENEPLRLHTKFAMPGLQQPLILTNNERNYVRIFRKLSPADQQKIIDMLENFKDEED